MQTQSFAACFVGVWQPASTSSAAMMASHLGHFQPTAIRRTADCLSAWRRPMLRSVSTFMLCCMSDTSTEATGAAAEELDSPDGIGSHQDGAEHALKGIDELAEGVVGGHQRIVSDEQAIARHELIVRVGFAPLTEGVPVDRQNLIAGRPIGGRPRDPNPL